MSDWAGKTPTVDEWRDILEKHAKWLRSEKGGMRAVLTGADLTDAVLRGAVLRGADLTDAVLTRAEDAELVIARTRILPDGDLIGWKKCQGGVIVQLLIPRSARRSHAFGRKCRAEAAVPMAIFPEGAEAKSLWTGDPPGSEEPLVYRINETVRPRKPWSEEWTQECASGLHFYITRAEAEAHA